MKEVIFALFKIRPKLAGEDVELDILEDEK